MPINSPCIYEPQEFGRAVVIGFFLFGLLLAYACYRSIRSGRVFTGILNFRTGGFARREENEGWFWFNWLGWALGTLSFLVIPPILLVVFWSAPVCRFAAETSPPIAPAATTEPPPP